jgi:hypothetical protein
MDESLLDGKGWLSVGNWLGVGNWCWGKDSSLGNSDQGAESNELQKSGKLVPKVEEILEISNYFECHF